MSAVTQRIVCAACRTLSGLIVCGPRHFDGTMWSRILNITLAEFNRLQELNQMPDDVPEDFVDWQAAEEGFIDQHGVFLTREEAWTIALRNGQILNYELDAKWATGRLYSEHLY